MNKEAVIKSLKEVGRWLICLLFGWIIAETLKQMNVLPEYSIVKIWVFSYNVPLRFIVQTVLTLAGRAIDKYEHEVGKTGESVIKLPF